MASYAELLTASENEALRQKVRVACVIAAETVRTEQVSVANHTARVVWAKRVFGSPESVMQSVMWAVLAQNRTQTFAAITGASDAAVQTAVDAAVDVFAQG